MVPWLKGLFANSGIAIVVRLSIKGPDKISDEGTAINSNFIEDKI